MFSVQGELRSTKYSVDLTDLAERHGRNGQPQIESRDAQTLQRDRINAQCQACRGHLIRLSAGVAPCSCLSMATVEVEVPSERGEVFGKPQPWLLDVLSPKPLLVAPRSTPRPRRGKREPRRQRAATVTVEARPGPDAPIGRLFQPATWWGGAAQRRAR